MCSPPFRMITSGNEELFCSRDGAYMSSPAKPSNLTPQTSQKQIAECQSPHAGLQDLLIVSTGYGSSQAIPESCLSITALAACRLQRDAGGFTWQQYCPLGENCHLQQPPGCPVAGRKEAPSFHAAHTHGPFVQASRLSSEN